MDTRSKQYRTISRKEHEKEAYCLPHGEDRISRLPDDLIHRILSLTDAMDAVQTSLLSTRWRNVWKSLSHLNFNRCIFSRMADFSKFVAKYLCHRDQQSDLSVFNLTCLKGVIQQSLLRKIITYGASHNIQQLNFSCEVHQLPPSVFTLQSLKQLSLTTYFRESIDLLKSPLDLPSLTTLFFDQVFFEVSGNDVNIKSVNFFAKLPNLKNLTLFDCEISGSEVFEINSPQLENLHIKNLSMAPRVMFVISAPKLSSFKYEGDRPLPLSANDLLCLDKVYLNIGRYYHWNYEQKQSVCKEVINMFHQLRDAKFVTVTFRTIQFLSLVFEPLTNQPCPFRNMECLKVEYCYSGIHLSSSSEVLTYLCNSSPRSTLINECSISFPDRDVGEG